MTENTEKKPPAGHGGKRTGAGRKTTAESLGGRKEHSIRVPVYVPANVKAWYTSLPSEAKSLVILAVIRGYAEKTKAVKTQDTGNKRRVALWVRVPESIWNAYLGQPEPVRTEIRNGVINIVIQKWRQALASSQAGGAGC
jgi:hypothetical protein